MASSKNEVEIQTKQTISKKPYQKIYRTLIRLYKKRVGKTKGSQKSVQKEGSVK